MEFFDWLNKIDSSLLLKINGANSELFDSFFSFFTSKEVWYPLYILLLIVFFRKYKLNALWVALFLVVAIVLSDQISVFIKELVQRFRPSHEPALSGLLNLPTGKRGMYGFVSSHAANSMALVVFVSLVSKSKRIIIGFGIWALLICYSRIYVGVHYPGDVVFGGILGGLLAWLTHWLLNLFDARFLRKKIEQSGSWESTYSSPMLIGLMFVTVTIWMVAQLMVA